MRLAVVVARLNRVGPLAAESALSLEQQGLGRPEAQREIEFATGDSRRVGILVPLEPPILHVYFGVTLARRGEAEACARRALIVKQASDARIR